MMAAAAHSTSRRAMLGMIATAPIAAGAAAVPAGASISNALLANWRQLSSSHAMALAASAEHDRKVYDPSIAWVERAPLGSAERERRFNAHGPVFDEAERLAEAAYKAEQAWLRAPAPDVLAVVEKLNHLRDHHLEIDEDRINLVVADLTRLARSVH